MSPQCCEVRLAKVLSKALGPPYAEDPPPPQAESTDLCLGRTWEGQGGIWKGGGTSSPSFAPHTVRGWPGKELGLELAGKAEEPTRQPGRLLGPAFAVQGGRAPERTLWPDCGVQPTDMHNRTFRTQDSSTFCPGSHDFGLEPSALPALFPHPSPGPNKGNLLAGAKVQIPRGTRCACRLCRRARQSFCGAGHLMMRALPLGAGSGDRLRKTRPRGQGRADNSRPRRPGSRLGDKAE